MAELLAAGPVAGGRVADVLAGGIGAEMYVASDGADGRFDGCSLAEVAALRGLDVPAAAHALLADAGEDFYDVVVVERWARDADLERAVLDDGFCLMGDGVTGALDGPLAGHAFSLSDWGWVVRTLGPLRARHGAARPRRGDPAHDARPGAPARARRPRRARRRGWSPTWPSSTWSGSGRRSRRTGSSPRPSGVPHVLVGGVPVVRDGQQTAARPGVVGR